MQPLTYAAVRADIAEALYLEPAELTDTEDLFAAGLDSVRLMGLIERWKKRGATPVFVELAEQPTLAAWWPLLAPPSAR
ncbi:phosphopantetheine attachment domain protein [Nocardia brasiliensis]|uniref:Phosphopantetheine attachment domain protein n=1 Tax=Nocardia brasiliensis TaxID=37326 RepID=A0A6G9XXN9_NOCBR|nr:phosphopantetheine-binding protein [Nocardia brasiliensis]QIS05702.1 phosphopantetheine attachment domain protein [Nocardia brasiliensis]